MGTVRPDVAAVYALQEVAQAWRRVSTALRQVLTEFSEFLFLTPIPGFSQKISHQEAVGATIGSSLDPQHPGFFGPV